MRKRTNAGQTTKSKSLVPPHIYTPSQSNVVKPFSPTHKLGTKFTHIPTNRVFILRAITDPRTLKPTRYLWCEDPEEEHFEINPSEWKLV